MKRHNKVKRNVVSRWWRRTCYLLYLRDSCTLGFYRHRKVVLLAQVIVRNLVSNDVPVTLKCLLGVCLAGGQRTSFGMYSPSWRWQTRASLKRWCLPYFTVLPCMRTSYPTIKPPPLIKMLFTRTGYSHLVHFFLFSFFEMLQSV